MTRALAAALLALASLSAPAQAQEAEAAELGGVWQGTVGDLPIHACFDQQGIYYYDRVLELIRLEAGDGGFAERVGWDEQGSAHWQIAPISASRAEGVWRDGERSLPIRLQRIAWDAPTMDETRLGACESQAFNGPRFTGGQVVSSPGESLGTPFTVLTWQPPAHFDATNADDFVEVAIATFALPETRPGDRLINAALAAYLPRGDIGDAYAQCLIANSSWRGIDGDFSQAVWPEVIAGRYLGLIVSEGNYCGGAHPNYWQHRRVFDRQSGGEIDPEHWLNDAALTREIYGEGEYAGVAANITDAFRAFVIARWPTGENYSPDCAGVAEDAYGWDVGLAPGGLAFMPELPHVIQACAETVTISWADLAPWLSLEGQAAAMTFAPAP